MSTRPTSTTATITRPDGATIAYHATPRQASLATPGLMFLGGFMSDMTGTKAVALEAHAQRHGLEFVRFDYMGHGDSSGKFEDGTIGAWAGDAVAVLDQVTEGPQILIGSSMGGWIMLLAALARPERVAGLIGIAAAPDFAEDLMWAQFPPEVRAQLESEGVYRQPSDYADEPYAITMTLIEEARRHLLLRAPIAIACPVHLLHGQRDPDVPWQTALKLSERLESRDVEVTLVKNGDHRLSEPRDLERLFGAVDAMAARLAR